MHRNPIPAGLAVLVILALSGCKAGGVVEVGQELDEEHGAGNTVLDENTGSGDGAGAYRVDARAHGTHDLVGNERFFSTDFRVDLADAAGNPLSGASVRMDTVTFDGVDLVEDPGNQGRYEASLFGYDRSYALTIDGPSGEFVAVAVGPAIHTIDPGPAPINAEEDWTITWDPSGATFCEIDTRGNGNHTIDDTGTFTVPGGQIDFELGDLGAERVRVLRWEELNLTGAAPVSTFEVSIEVENNDLETVDTRTGAVGGDVSLDPDLNIGGSGHTVYILAWPEQVDGEGDAWAWTSVQDFPATSTYTLSDLAPGDWFLRAYLDLDLSDDGRPVPQGPTNGDPFEERDVTVDANGSVTRDLTLQDTW